MNAEMQTHALQTPWYLSQVESSRARQNLEEMSENGLGRELSSSSQDPLRSLGLGLTALILKGAWAEGREVEHSGLLPSGAPQEFQGEAEETMDLESVVNVAKSIKSQNGPTTDIQRQ